jgi:hypothetical protein
LKLTFEVIAFRLLTCCLLNSVLAISFSTLISIFPGLTGCVVSKLNFLSLVSNSVLLAVNVANSVPSTFLTIIFPSSPNVFLISSESTLIFLFLIAVLFNT